jgi:hypothetical protein
MDTAAALVAASSVPASTPDAAGAVRRWDRWRGRRAARASDGAWASDIVGMVCVVVVVVVASRAWARARERGVEM